MSKNKVVIGLVDAEVQAENIVQKLQADGFSSSDISVIMPDKHGTKDFAHEHNTKAPEGAVVGGASGGVVGGALGLLAGIGALAIPGFGPFIAAGPLMAALSGAAAGAAVGGVAGALVGMGIPEIEAKTYEGKVKGGNILLSVHVDGSDERSRAKKILETGGATDVVTAGEERVSSKERAEYR